MIWKEIGHMTLYIALYGYHEGYFIETREFLTIYKAQPYDIPTTSDQYNRDLETPLRSRHYYPSRSSSKLALLLSC
jgi:hypothetical protein